MSVIKNKRVIYLLLIAYWGIVGYFIFKYFCQYVPAPHIGLAGDKVPIQDFNQNTFFHIENIAIGFVGCFIGALTVSVFQIIFSYAQVFKFLKEMYPQINLSDKEEEKRLRTEIAVTIEKGYNAENVARRIVYSIFFVCILISFSLGIFLLGSRWNESHYLFLKAILLFLLIGIVPIFIGMILYLLTYPGAPLKKLLFSYKVVIDKEHNDYLASLSTHLIKKASIFSFKHHLLNIIGALISFIQKILNISNKII